MMIRIAARLDALEVLLGRSPDAETSMSETERGALVEKIIRMIARRRPLVAIPCDGGISEAEARDLVRRR